MAQPSAKLEVTAADTFGAIMVVKEVVAIIKVAIIGFFVLRVAHVIF